MNIKITPKEIINYCHNGTLGNVSAEQLLQVAEFYEEKLGKPNKGEGNYNTGYEDGHSDAIGEMRGKLDAM